MNQVVCFGEVLWDLFPDGKKLGGAPLNVALRMNSWGIKSQIISCVGNDILGEELLASVKSKGIDPKYIQINKSFDTGTVGVCLNEEGSATYKIAHPVGWDKMELISTYEKLVSSSKVFIFGSLIARDQVSKNCLLSLLNKSNYSVFDINLRAPFYSISDIELLMKRADFIKFNNEELHEICIALGCNEKSIENKIEFISSKTGTHTICVTLGKEGAILYRKAIYYRQNGYHAKVVDTVGAGDSFLGTLITNLLRENGIKESLNKACATGALVTQTKGANPIISEEMLVDFMEHSDHSNEK